MVYNAAANLCWSAGLAYGSLRHCLYYTTQITLVLFAKYDYGTETKDNMGQVFSTHS